MKKIFGKFSVLELIALFVNFVACTICTIVINSIDAWIAWASCITYIIYWILNANSKYICFVWIIISYIIYMYFNIKEMYWGELALSVFSVGINIVAMINWKKHTKDKNLVINKISPKELILSFLITIVSGVAVYFVLKALNTNQLVLNVVLLTVTLLEYYLTFRRTYLKFVVGFVSLGVYIALWSLALNPANNFALLFVINGSLNVFWYIDGILIWKKIQKENASKNGNLTQPQ